MLPERGDFLFTSGSGWVSRLIKRGSPSPWSHVGQVIDVVSTSMQYRCFLEGIECVHTAEECRVLACLLHTVEAYGDDGGLNHRLRWVVRAKGPERLAFLLMRTGRSTTQTEAMVARTLHLAGTSTGYDWLEIGRIAARQVGIKVKPLDVFPTRQICSGASAYAALGGRPELAALMPTPWYGIWPGALRECLAQLAGVEHLYGWVPAGQTLVIPAPFQPGLRAEPAS